MTYEHTGSRPATDPPEPMPQDVRIARVILWIQFGVNALACALLLTVVTDMTDHGRTATGETALLLFTTAFAVLLGVLAVSCGSRRKWVRVTALTVEGLLVLNQLIVIVMAFTPFAVLGLLLAIGAIVRLSRYDAVVWFQH